MSNDTTGASATHHVSPITVSAGGQTFRAEKPHVDVDDGAPKVAPDSAPGSQAYSEQKPEDSEGFEWDHELAGLDALEDARPGERPAYPFTTLIRYAIRGSPKRRLLLEEIYQAIQTRYPYFVTAPAGWKNSVRHTLSLMTCFEKVPRMLTEPGKGSYWTVNNKVPHAQPSRIRVRKRKARPDDDEDNDDSPYNTRPSTPDTTQSEVEPPLASVDSRSQRRAPYDWTEGSAPRDLSYAASGSSQQYYTNQGPFRAEGPARYYDNENAHTFQYRTQDQAAPEPFFHGTYGSHSHSRWSEPYSQAPSTQPLDSGRFVEAPRPAGTVDYRLLLMSELEKFRNLVARREDLDEEWCRQMIERLRATGLDS